MNKITSVCVYCASSTKIDSAYFEAARELGTLLGQRHIRLINGAGGIGLMSATADAVLAAGGEVTGVIPHFMVEQGWQHKGAYGDDRSGKHAPAQAKNGGSERCCHRIAPVDAALWKNYWKLSLGNNWVST